MSETPVRKVTLQIGGRLDSNDASILRASVGAELAQGPTSLTLDLSATELIDEAGLAALVEAFALAHSGGGELRLVRPISSDARRIFSVTRLDEVFEMCDSVEEVATSAPGRPR